MDGGSPSPPWLASIDKTRSAERFVASLLGIKSWCEQTPSCADARPATCPCCEAPSRPLGGRLGIVGHGVVERQLLGPATWPGPPEASLVKMRRYRCRACKAIVVVGPRGVVRRRSYRVGAIAGAIAAYARGETSAAVRRLVSPHSVVGGSARERWVTLTRWIDAAQGGRLFAIAGLVAAGRRRVAELVMLALAARAGSGFGVDLIAAAFVGAAVAA